MNKEKSIWKLKHIAKCGCKYTDCLGLIMCFDQCEYHFEKMKQENIKEWILPIFK